MKRLFNKIPLPAKLMLIGVVPLIFFIVLAVQLYNDRVQKVKLLGSYIHRMEMLADMSKFISEFQKERKHSFDYSLSKTSGVDLAKQRPATDSALRRMSKYDAILGDFNQYTFLDQLANVRTAVDSGYFQPGVVMDYYSSTIFRLNTLNALPTGSAVYLQPVYKDLVGQKLLSEMTTYLGILTANIYNALYTRKYMIEILVGSAGTYRVYKTYQKEFQLRASSNAIAEYQKLKTSFALDQTDRYLDSVFSKLSFDSSYSHEGWDRVSTLAINNLRDLQQKLLEQVESATERIHRKSKTAGDRTLYFIIFSIVVVSAFVLYMIYSISRALRELSDAAYKISKGAHVDMQQAPTQDAVGNLSNSIAAIDQNNTQLAKAAQAIGSGHFEIPIEPRSSDDILGHALVEMKSNLQKSTSELKESNKELERFAYIASHDLQEPLRMVSSFLNLLEEEHKDQLDPAAREYIRFAVDGASRMKTLVNDLLQYSRVGTNKEEFSSVDLKETIDYVLRVLELEVKEKNAVVKVNPLPVIRANKTLMSQLFMNLVGNALKYHGNKAPQIEIGSLDEKDQVTLYVKDHGIGIDPKFFDKIFIIFQRLHNKAEYSGTGIGLAICKKIAEVHKAKIWVESKEDQGSTFYFKISKHNI